MILKKSNQINSYFLFVATLGALSVLFLMLYRNLAFSETWAFGDLLPFPSDLTITQNWTFFLWNHEGLGFISYKPFNINVIILLASSLFGELAAQKIIFLSLPVFSFMSFYFLLKKLKLSWISATLGSLLYCLILLQ